MPEKRVSERVFKRLEVQFRTIVENTAITSNLSESGLFIRTKRGIPMGSILDIKLNLPGLKEIHLTGKVVRSMKTVAGLLGESKSGMGVHLIDPPADYTDYVQSLIS
ncbi:MAG TPA: hypothetical protein ENG80_00220 [Nitrospirae bacterium]|nr:PilZ domain protein [bacterium BMS3Abin10]GBE37772.1 PilZ domain protein [bacterium BMS3Bbin08]HDH00221.1 hypothetical protein [Nitrospirota bacterium]